MHCKSRSNLLQFIIVLYMSSKITEFEDNNTEEHDFAF